MDLPPPARAWAAVSMTTPVKNSAATSTTAPFALFSFIDPPIVGNAAL
jgi:hypothetical protein